MRVGFDATAAAWQSAGIGRSVWELLRSMLSQSGDDIDWVVFYQGHRTAARLEAMLATFNIRPMIVPFSPRLGFALWQRLRLPLPLELFTGQLDLLHAPDFVLPFSFAKAKVVTIHDLSFLTHPHTADANLQVRLDRAVRRALERADRVICISRTTANDVVSLLDYDPNRIDVIYCGLDSALSADPSEAELARLDEIHLPSRFVLSVGTLQPRKNLLRITRAVASLRASGEDVGLVHAGARGWISDADLGAIESTGAGFLHRLGPVDDGLLRALYARAGALAAVSEAEGFMLPMIEAMAHGVPVVTASVSCMPEIAADAALLANPYDHEEIATSLQSALTRGSSTTELIARGHARARDFDWDKAGAETLAAYRRAAR